MTAEHPHALVLAPHQDDEINIAGQILPSLIELGYHCTVCFSTDGNDKGQGPVRAKEALQVASLFGFELGQWGLPPLTQMIEQLMPEVIICVDFDWHPDHRVLSMAAEEALGEVMREHPGYSPVFLKKFAYAASWDGPTDYYSFAPSLLENDEGALDNPTLFWDERVALLPHSSTITPRLSDNVVYQAFELYESQLAWPKTRSVCNTDVPYWVRRTDDLCLQARIAASSGEISDLLNFKRFDVCDVLERNPELALSREYGWKPDEKDECPLLLLRFKEPVEVAYIDTYWSSNDAPFGDALSVLVDGKPIGFSWSTKGCRTRLEFEELVIFCELALAVPDWPSKDMRLTSLEAYPPVSECTLALDRLIEDINAHGVGVRPSQWGKLKDFALKHRVFFYYRLGI